MEAVGIDFMSCGVFEYAKGNSASAQHTHSYFQIIYVSQSDGSRLCVGNREGELMPCCVYTLPAGVLHRLDCRKGGCVLHELRFHITDSELHEKVKSGLPAARDTQGRMKEYFERLNLEGYMSHDESACLLIRLLLCELLRTDAVGGLLPMRMELSDDMQRLIWYINENYSREMTVTDMANFVHRERAYFSKRFKRQTGMTPMKYLNSVRAANSLQLLEYTDRKIGLIAEQVGFRSTNSYVKLFRQLYKTSPTEYRRACRKTDIETT